MKKLLFLLLSFYLVSCTENQRAKKFGGNADVNLPNNSKLINVTWKETNLWYLTRPMTINDSAETYIFQEKSSFGILEGTFIIKETKIEAEKGSSYFDNLQNK